LPRKLYGRWSPERKQPYPAIIGAPVPLKFDHPI
jgi:hypothetical protein